MLMRGIRPLHKRYREQKLDLFFQSIAVKPGDTLLDVGGGTGITGEFRPLYESFDHVTLLNIRISPRPAIRIKLDMVCGDGCQLPFAPRAFDWVFSNAVLEHVGGEDQQRQFASEIRRVARKGYFVATPNRNFPIEPHTLLPFYQFMPEGLQRRLVPFSPGYLTEYEQIRLVSRGELQGLFPEAQVVACGVPGLPNNLIAFCHAIVGQQ